jgi:hypothetical protein
MWKGFYGYYYTFEPTGCDEIDEILKELALAGHSFHHTMYWQEHGHIDRIQDAANKAAERFLSAQPPAARDEAICE